MLWFCPSLQHGQLTSPWLSGDTSAQLPKSVSEPLNPCLGAYMLSSHAHFGKLQGTMHLLNRPQKPSYFLTLKEEVE